MNSAAIFWICWFVFVVSLTWSGLLWEIDYFRGPGPAFYHLLLVLLTAFPLVLAAYHWRRRAWLKWEPMIVALPAIAGLAYEPRATLVVISIVFAVLAGGRQLRILLGLQADGPIEDIVIAAALGFGALNCVLFLLGLARLYAAWVLAGLVAAVLLLCARQLPDIWAAFIEATRGWMKEAEFQSLLGSLLALFGLALMVTTLMVTLAPSLAFDVNAMHLPLVHYYASQHALATPSYLSYGYYPQSIEVLMTTGYVLGGDAAAQMLPPVFFALTLVAAYRIGRLCGFSRFASFTGVVFSAAMPFVHWTGSVAKNDLALAFFILAALVGYLRWRQVQDFRWILAAAFFLAMAAGVKHIVVFAIPPLALLFLHAAFRQRSPLRSVAAVILIFIGFGLFWHTRTWILTGNPLSPQTASVAGRTAVRYNGSVWQHVVLTYLNFPWKLFFLGRRYFESPLDQPLGIMLVLFAPVWVLVRKRIAAIEMACLIFCGLYFAYWAFAVGMVRYAIAPFILVTVITASRLIAFWRGLPNSAGFSVVLASAYALLFGLFGIAILEINAPQLRYFTFRIDRVGYLREALAPYRALEFVNQAMHSGDSVFTVEACAVVYARDPSTFDCALLRNSTPQQIRALIGRKEYRFIITPKNHPEFVPDAWNKAYSDESYDVLTRK